MRRFLLMIALSSVSLWVPNLWASTIDYTINFADGTPDPISGSFGYDATTQQFSNFIVDWDGTLFDLTASANSPGIGGTPSCVSGTGAQAAFQLMTSCATDPSAKWEGQNTYSCCGSSEFQFSIANDVTDFIEIEATVLGSNSTPNVVTDGTYASVATVPDPGTLGLFMIGIVSMLVLGMGKRNIKLP